MPEESVEPIEDYRIPDSDLRLKVAHSRDRASGGMMCRTTYSECLSRNPSRGSVSDLPSLRDDLFVQVTTTARGGVVGPNCGDARPTSRNERLAATPPLDHGFREPQLVHLGVVGDDHLELALQLGHPLPEPPEDADNPVPVRILQAVQRPARVSSAG